MKLLNGNLKYMPAIVFLAVAFSFSPAFGLPDAGYDAGMDAGSDAGIDAGMDASLESFIIMDRVAAIAGDDVITISDVKILARMMMAFRRGPAALAVPADPSFERNVLEFLINQHLVLQEMRKSGDYTLGLGDDAAENDIKVYKARFSEPGEFAAFLKGMDLSEEQFRDIILVGARSEKYLMEKFKAGWEPGTDEAEQYYQNNQDKFPGISFAEAEKSIKSMMTIKRSEKLVADYLNELRSRYEVRVITVPR